MKKSYIIGGAAILAAALGFVIYINMKGPSSASDSGAAVSSNEQRDSASHTSGQGSGNGSGLNGLNQMGSAADPKNQVLENVVVNSRIAEEFKFLDEQMEAQYENLKKMASPEELEIFERLRAQLKGDDLLAQFREVLKKKFNESELAHLNTLYQDPAFIKSKELEARGRTPEGQKEIMDYTKNLDLKSLPQERQAALEKLVDATGSVDNMMDMLKNVETIFSGSMSKPNNKNVQAYEDLMRKSLKEYMMKAAAFNHRNSDVSGIEADAKVMGDPLLRAAEALKTGFVGETLVTVAKPEVDRQMQEQQQQPK